jgi:hypothetical protein
LSLPGFRDQLSHLEGLEDWPVLLHWGRLLDLVSLRRNLPADAPLLTILLGPTGVGKSTLFNQVLGRKISATGAVRPCTTHPLGIAPPDVAEFFGRDPWLRQASVVLDLHTEIEVPPGLARQAILDTPDFDSVAEENRGVAEALLYRADRVILVLNPEKYADASVWDTLETLLALGNLVGCVFNKSEGGVALDDCTGLLEAAGCPRPLAIPRLARPDDVGSLAPELRQDLRSLLAPPAPLDAVFAERRVDLERWETQVRSGQLEPWINRVHDALDQAEAELGRQASELPRRIRKRLPLELDEALGRELQERFLEKIQKYDFLRGPRQWLSAPFRWLGGSIPFLRLAPETKRKPMQSTAEWLTRAHLDRYLEFLADLGEELRSLAVNAAAATEPSLPWPRFAEPDPEAATRALERVFGELQREMERESSRISDTLSSTGKLTFYGSQAVFHLLVLTVLVKTGGGLSLGDLAAQGLVSPYVAKIFAHFVSSGEATKVRRRLEDLLANKIEREVRPMLAPLQRHAEVLRSAVRDPSGWREAVRAWDAEGA